MERTKYNKKQRVEAYSEAYAAVKRLRLATGLGIQYDGKRDVYQALGYPKILRYEDYYAKYTRQDIASAIVDKPVDTTWRGDIQLVTDSDEDTTPLEQAWETLYEDLGLKSVLSRADRLASLGQYGAILLGFDDAKTVQAMADPVKEGQRKLVYVKPLSERQAQITESDYETDVSNPRYGLPKYYQVYINQNSVSVKVHYSRIIHITGKLLENEVCGLPYLQQVYNRLIDLEKIVGGSGEMFWRGARPGYTGKVDKDFTISDTDKEQFMVKLEEYENDLRRFLINEGVEMKALETQVSDPTKHVDVQLQMISSNTNIPKRLLIGSERGELASTQDQDEWYGFIGTRRTEHAEPKIVRPFVDRLIKYNVLPEETYQVKWEDLFSKSDKEKAEVGKTRATALKEYTQNLDAQTIVPPEQFLSLFLGLDDTQVEIVRKAMEDMSVEEPALTEEEMAMLESEEINEDGEESGPNTPGVVETNTRTLKRTKKARK